MIDIKTFIVERSISAFACIISTTYFGGGLFILAGALFGAMLLALGILIFFVGFCNSGAQSALTRSLAGLFQDRQRDWH